MSEKESKSEDADDMLSVYHVHPGDILTITVSGMQYRTLLTTLRKLPLTKLGKIAADLSNSTQHFPHEIFFDREPAYFGPILTFYRTSILHFPHVLCVPLMRQELRFWGIAEDYMAPCCQDKMNDFDRLERERDELEKQFHALETIKTSQNDGDNCDSWKHTVWVFLIDPSSSRGAKIWTTVYLALLFASIIIVALDSIEEYRIERSASVNISKLAETLQFSHHQMLFIRTRSNPVLIYADCVVSGLFTLEILVKLCVAPNMREYVKHLLTIFDLLWLVLHWCWMTLYLTIVDIIVKQGVAAPVILLASLGICSITMRVLRLSRVVCYFCELQVMVLTLKASIREIALLVLLLVMGAMVFGPFIFYAELTGAVTNIDNIPVGFWWAVVTMTTVGYGDRYPTALGGYMVGVACVGLGLVFTGLPISVISANYTKYQAFAYSLQERRRKANAIHAAN